ncbi:MAG TPA: hypothetical protein VL026_11200 [Rhizomicrobium sp.]|nr:hypothetical protein [Rhizomicrobium sp.]
MKNVTRSLILILALPVLGACQTERMLAKCPSTAILAETSSQSVFVAGKPMAPENLAYRIDTRRATTACSIDKDTNTADSSLELAFRGFRQKDGAAASYTVPFFVAINDSDGKLVLKKTYSTTLVFQPGQTQVDFTQTIDSIPVKVARTKQPFDYHLLVGFQLTKQQLDYNRKTNRYAE